MKIIGIVLRISEPLSPPGVSNSFSRSHDAGRAIRLQRKTPNIIFDPEYFGRPSLSILRTGSLSDGGPGFGASPRPTAPSL
jgi:hypothetical protein